MPTIIFIDAKEVQKKESALVAHFLEYGSTTTKLYIYTAFCVGDDMKTRSPFLNYIADYMLVRQYSLRTVDMYLKWIASYIHFHDKRHLASMGDNEVERYLEYLVLKQNVAPRTQATALNSLSFLYKHIIKKSCR
ncbi:hypothetical protein PSECIP111854_00455 [Pseudoalteromonas sp. CIP111854]|uniref:Core-binding (CB) domain-containing protein n=1 Tax=Pseudoalteromonas holothuriae TaxID=2963714 RepID=A0A9W4QRI8_9GAMM|nr:hypothetical protein PSECIP111854_00455 [Pseudoalteromonas sp. CIP111854]